MNSEITDTPQSDAVPIATAVSIRATRETLDALLVIAAQRRCKVADIVADAVEQVYGDEIRKLISFFASTDYKTSQMTKNRDEA